MDPSARKTPVLFVVGIFSEELQTTVNDTVADSPLSSASVTDFTVIATLGVGGFGRVELVRIRRTLCLHSASLIYL